MNIWQEKNKKTKQDGWCLDVTIDCVRYRRWFPNRDALNRFVKHKQDEQQERRDGVPNKKKSRVTLLQLIAAFLADDLVTSKTKNYQGALQRSVLSFAALIGDADIFVSEIKAQHLKDFLTWVHKGHSNGSTLNYYRHVMTMLRAASDLFPDALNGYQPPALNLRRLGLDLKHKHRERILTAEEMRKVYQALRSEKPYHREARKAAKWRREHGADFFALLFLTLKRQNEIISLTWQDVSFDLGTIGFKITKTKDYQVLPMSPEVRAILQRRKESGHARPFPAHNCEMRYAAFRRASNAANVPYGEKTPSGYVPHDLRHTAGSYLVHAGIDPVTVGVLLGHQLGDGSTPHYLHASPATLQQAMLKAGELWQTYLHGEAAASSQVLLFASGSR